MVYGSYEHVWLLIEKDDVSIESIVKLIIVLGIWVIIPACANFIRVGGWVGVSVKTRFAFSKVEIRFYDTFVFVVSLKRRCGKKSKYKIIRDE